MGRLLLNGHFDIHRRYANHRLNLAEELLDQSFLSLGSPPLHHIDLDGSVGRRSATWVIKILGLHWDKTMSPLVFRHSEYGLHASVNDFGELSLDRVKVFFDSIDDYHDASCNL